MADLENIVCQLKEQLVHKEEDVHTAAEIGKALLQENTELKDKLEDVVKCYSRKTEEYEQEIYGLQLKLDHKSSLEEWYNEEISQLKQELQKQRETIFEEINNERNKETSQFKKQISHLQTDLEQAQSVELQLREKVEQLEELVQQQLEQTNNLSRSFYSEELGQFQQDILNCQSENTGLRAQVIDIQTELKHVKGEANVLKARYDAKVEEIEELQCEITSYANTVERSRTEIMDLKAQMEVLRMEANNHRKKGNSLFSEVEDRRIEAEKKLISQNIHLETFKDKYEMEKQQHHKLKMQMVMLLQLSSGHTDSASISQLQNQLFHARSEVKVLTEKLLYYEKSGKCKADHLAEFHKAFGQSTDKDYVQYLLAVLKSAEDEASKLNQELRNKNLLLLDESNKVLRLEKRILEIGCEREKLRSQNMKMALKNEELLMKYEPDKLKTVKQVLRETTEKIPLDEPSTELQENMKPVIKESHRTQGLNTSTFVGVGNTNKSLPVKTGKENSEPVSESLKSEVDKNVQVLKGRSVSISDTVKIVEEDGNEVKQAMSDQQRDGKIEERKLGGIQSKTKGRVVQKVKQVKTSQQNVNDCKSQ